MIPVVMAADKNYFYPLMTSMAAILENKHVDTNVEFYLFVDSDYTQEDKQRINDLLSSKGVVPAHFLDASEEYGNTQMHIKHITAATYYRLKIPSSLPNLDKCLYLDVDTLVRTDLTAIYNKPIGDSYIMGVLAAGYQASDAGKAAKAKALGIPHIDNYVNAGVLVFNLSRIREDNLEDRFDQLFNEGFPDQDQDILNAACFDAIKVLPPEFNAMTKYEFGDCFYETDESIIKCWSKWEWDKARKDPLILHFADIDKPWANFAVPFAKEWWHYAKAAGVADESFDYYFDAHAANEVKIHKQKMEIWRTRFQRDEAVKKFDQAQKDMSTMSIKLENIQKDNIAITSKLNDAQKEAADATSRLESAQKTHEKVEADLEMQLSATQECETKLADSLELQRVTADELAQARCRITSLESDIERLRDKNEQINIQVVALGQQLQESKKRVVALEHSNSYRLGRALSAPFRWVKRMMKRMRG